MRVSTIRSDLLSIDAGSGYLLDAEASQDEAEEAAMVLTLYGANSQKLGDMSISMNKVSDLINVLLTISKQMKDRGAYWEGQ